jgi:hypothetical protein
MPTKQLSASTKQLSLPGATAQPVTAGASVADESVMRIMNTNAALV